MIDRYLTGRVDRISPEAPVPVVRWQEQHDRLGGAANVALNLHALGTQVGTVGVVGQDDNGHQLRELFTAQGLSDEYILSVTDRPTTVKTRILSQDQQLLRVDRESTEAIPADAARQLFLRLEARLREAPPQLIILQDYNKGVLSDSVIEGVLGLARQYGVLTTVDPKATNFWAYRGVDLFKPNLREVQQQLDQPVGPNQQDLDRAARVLFDRLACRRIMITLSQHGIYVHDGTASDILPTVARRIADVSGAGDSVIAVASCALAVGMPLRDIARLANRAGAQVIAHPGVVALDRAALQIAWEQEA